MTHSLPVPQPDQRHVAVIGAGLAGLACAQALVSAGALVQVFEKSRGVSGRMSTRRGEGWQCDHGAAALWTPEVRVYDGAEAGVFTSHASRVDRFVGTPGMTAPTQLSSIAVHCGGLHATPPSRSVRANRRGFCMRPRNGVRRILRRLESRLLLPCCRRLQTWVWSTLRQRPLA